MEAKVSRKTRPYYTSGKPMKRRLAYKIYEVLELSRQYQKACTKVFGDTNPPATAANLKLIADEMGVKPKALRSLKSYNADQIRRALRKVDRDVFSRRTDKFTRYKIGKRWREQFENSEFGKMTSESRKTWQNIIGDMSMLTTILQNVVADKAIPKHIIDNYLAELKEEREKFTKSDKNKMRLMVEALIIAGVYPAVSLSGNTAHVMVDGWGAYWHIWTGPFECHVCKTDLRDYKAGPPFKREICMKERGSRHQHLECPECHAVLEDEHLLCRKS